MGRDPADDPSPAPPRHLPPAGPRPPAEGPRERLADLRARLSGALPGASPPGSSPPSSSPLPLGPPALDGCLPGGGLALGPPHEVAPAEAGDWAAALGFALALCARHLARAPGEALVAGAPAQGLPHGHGLRALGLDPGRLLLLRAGGDAEVFRALEAALHARALRVLVGLVAEGLPLKAGRRLQLAAEGPAPPLLLILRPAGAAQANGAATRWRIASAPAARDRFGCLAAPRWRVRLERCRNGRGGDWLLEWDRAAHRLHQPERLAGDAPAPGRSRA